MFVGAYCYPKKSFIYWIDVLNFGILYRYLYNLLLGSCGDFVLNFKIALNFSDLSLSIRVLEIDIPEKKILRSDLNFLVF